MDSFPPRSVGLWVRKHGAPALAVAAAFLLSVVKFNRPAALTWAQVLMPVWGPLVGMIVIWAIGMVEARLVCVFQDAFFPRPSAMERPDA